MTLGEIYSWIWYHTEFWIAKKINRRPFTYIMRDFIFGNPKPAAGMIATWYAGMFALLYWHPFVAGALLLLSSFVLGHVVWGSKWTKGEQEYPAYNPNGNGQ